VRGEDGLTVAASAGDVPATNLLEGAEGTLVPLVFRGRSLGMLAAYGPNAASDEALLRAFAANAATAVATARTVEEKRLRGALAAAEAERARWARELHDETLQSLGALRLLLVAARRSGDAEGIGLAVERLEEEIDGLRGLIRDLRPAALDDLGLGPAIEGLAERTGRREGFEVAADIRLPPERLSAELETAAYRIVQEALTNAVRHAGAARVEIAVDIADGAVRAQVRDDGRGFDPGAPVGGFGLTGMRERIALLRGELEIASSESGTCVTAALPLDARRSILPV
jgi:signal transduction histidine kinase